MRPNTSANKKWNTIRPTIPPNKAGISCRCSKRCTLFGKTPEKSTKNKSMGTKKRIASKTLNPFR